MYVIRYSGTERFYQSKKASTIRGTDKRNRCVEQASKEEANKTTQSMLASFIHSSDHKAAIHYHTQVLHALKELMTSGPDADHSVSFGCAFRPVSSSSRCTWMKLHALPSTPSTCQSVDRFAAVVSSRRLEKMRLRPSRVLLIAMALSMLVGLSGEDFSCSAKPQLKKGFHFFRRKRYDSG